MEHRNLAKPFTEINIGDEASFEVDIDEEIHQNFSELVKDYSPIHFKEDYFSQTTYKKKIGFGFLLMILLSRFYGEYLPGGSSICIKQDAKFVKPYYIGDKIKIVGKVMDKFQSTSFVEIEVKMYRENDECVFKGKGTVQVLPIKC